MNATTEENREKSSETNNNNNNNNNKMTRRLINKDVNVDEEDYRVLDWDSNTSIQFETDNDDEEKRICSVTILLDTGRDGIPNEIGKLSALKELIVSDFVGLSSIPPSIGMLQNLERLDLSENLIERLPREIGNLINLKELDLSYNPISSLPHSIGNLQSLTTLDITETDIVELPNEIWGLWNLKKLDAHAPQLLLDVPPSIERLENLEHLSLSTKGRLPKEFGNLKKLKYLCLGGSKDCLPFPCENGLGQLECLRLWRLSNLCVRQLDFVRKLPNLKSLYFHCWRNKNWTQEDLDFLLDLVRDTKSLGHTDVSREAEMPELTYALACNRFYQKTSFRGGTEESALLLKKLWPLLFTKATNAFQPLLPSIQKEASKRGVDAPNAVYKLLMAARGSFVQVLLDRKSNNNKSRSRSSSNKNNNNNEI